MTAPEVRDLIATWQDRLGLRDWRIAPVLIPASTIDDEGRVARCYYWAEALRAKLHLAAKCEAATMEANVVHELAHLVMAETVTIAKAAANQLGPDARALTLELLEAADERAVRRWERCLCGAAADSYFRE